VIPRGTTLTASTPPAVRLRKTVTTRPTWGIYAQPVLLSAHWLQGSPAISSQTASRTATSTGTPLQQQAPPDLMYASQRIRDRRTASTSISRTVRLCLYPVFPPIISQQPRQPITSRCTAPVAHRQKVILCVSAMEFIDRRIFR